MCIREVRCYQLMQLALLTQSLMLLSVNLGTKPGKYHDVARIVDN
jgi:hypothetical protein